MLGSFKKKLKQDFWNIIDKNEEGKRDLNDFVLFIFYMLLEKQKFSMEDVLKASSLIKGMYYEILDESKQIALRGDLIKALKNIDEEFCNKIKPIIEKCLK